MRSDLREVGRPRELGKTSIRDRPISGSKTQRDRVRTADTRPSSARVQEIVLSAIRAGAHSLPCRPSFSGPAAEAFIRTPCRPAQEARRHANARGFCGLQIDRQLEFYRTGSSGVSPWPRRDGRSDWPWSPEFSLAISPSVRYSPVRSSAFGLRIGVPVRFSIAEATTRRGDAMAIRSGDDFSG